MPEMKRKVIAYITWGNALLVFRQPAYPEAGVQVPAGTIEPGEMPVAAALREAGEETGLSGLALIAQLGEQVYDMAPFGKNEWHHRTFFHLRCTETPPRTWRHMEASPSDGSDPIAFDFFWAQLPAGAPLIAAHDAYLPALLRSLGLTSE